MNWVPLAKLGSRVVDSPVPVIPRDPPQEFDEKGILVVDREGDEQVGCAKLCHHPEQVPAHIAPILRAPTNPAEYRNEMTGNRGSIERSIRPPRHHMVQTLYIHKL